MKLRELFRFGLAVAWLALVIASTSLLLAQSENPSPQTQNAQGQAQVASPNTPATPQTQSPASAPEQASGPILTFHETVRRVLLDVMVRDKTGNPVQGLTANDFSITEDKAPQQILSFDVYNFDKQSISRGANAPPLPSNVFVNVPTTPERGPLYVMLLDLVNTEVDDQMTARQQISKFIRSKPDGTRFAVFVNSDELYLSQGFTADKDQLYAALDPKHPKIHMPRVFLYGANYGRNNPATMVDILTHIGQYLDGIPGRKNLIWVAGTFPMDFFPREADPADLQDAIREETNALAQAEVAIFPLNVRGVVVNPEGALTGASPKGGSGGAGSGPPLNSGGPASSSGQSGSSQVASSLTAAQGVVNEGGSSLTGDYAAADEIARMTGGRAFYSTNDLSGALEAATEDGGNYYTITYAPPRDADDGKCHTIAVKVDKPGYTLSYREYYCRAPLLSSISENGEQKLGAVPLAVPIVAGDVLQANMKQGGPMLHDLIFSAHLRAEGGATLATPEQMVQIEEQASYYQTHRRNRPAKPMAPVKIQTYAVDYRVLDPELKARAGKGGQEPTLEFAIAAFDREGKTLNGIVNDGVAEVATEQGENKSGLFRVRQSLVVPVGAVSIRVGVRDRMSDRMGTLEVPLPLAPPQVSQASPVH
jgi:VWFA-related protein